MNSLKRFIIVGAVVFLNTLTMESSAQSIAFAGNLDLIAEDLGGGVYSGVPQDTFFTGTIDPQTGGGEISDGTTTTTFTCCIAAGGLSIDNDSTLDGETAALLNLLSGTSTFFAGQIVDSVDIEGDTTTAGNGRIEVGLSYILSPDSFDDNSPDNYPFDLTDVLLSVFFIVEEDGDGEDIYSGIGLLRNVIPATERDALLSLFASTGGTTWNSNAGWDQSPASIGTECTWAGVTCSESSVIALDLMSNNLTGAIPPQLGNIPSLRQLDLSFNQLSGPIPAELANPVDLELLWVNDNQLSGQVPQALLDDQDLDFNFANNPGLFTGNPDPDPDPPPAIITLNSDGSPTTALVSGGITKDGGETYITDFQVGDTIQFFVRLEPEASDIGINSEIFVVAVAGPTSLLVTPGGLLTWDGQLGSLVPFDEIVLAAEIEFNILQPFGGEFTLSAAETGSYAFFIGYTVGGGVVTYNGEPIVLNVSE